MPCATIKKVGEVRIKSEKATKRQADCHRCEGIRDLGGIQVFLLSY
jgi:hypothetical protein